MDKLLNEFTVRRPIEATWQILTDLERIAPCMPGAELQEIEGDEYRGVVKVKLGAIQASFKGQASFVERDDANHTATLKAAGRDTGGKGNADALITARLEPHGDDTTCIVETDLRITGKVAQFGRSIMADVSKKLMAQFAQNLNEMIEADGQAPVTPPAVDTPVVRKIDGPAADPIELSEIAGGAILKRLLPLLGGLAVLLLVLRRRRRR